METPCETDARPLLSAAQILPPRPLPRSATAIVWRHEGRGREVEAVVAKAAAALRMNRISIHETVRNRLFLFGNFDDQNLMHTRVGSRCQMMFPSELTHNLQGDKPAG